MITRIVLLLSMSLGCIYAQLGTQASFARGGFGAHPGSMALIDRDSLFDVDPVWADMDGPIHPSMLRAGGFPGAAGLAGFGGGLGVGGNFNAPASNFDGASQFRGGRDFSRGQRSLSQGSLDQSGAGGRFSQGVDQGFEAGSRRSSRSGVVSRTVNRSSSRTGSGSTLQSSSGRRVGGSRLSNSQRLRLQSLRG